MTDTDGRAQEHHALDRRQSHGPVRPAPAATYTTRLPARSAATSTWAGRLRFNAAVAAAKAAFADWRKVSLSRRASILFSFRELVKAHISELAAAVTAEHGKVASDAAGEVARGLEVVEFACGIPHLLKGGFSENVSTGVDSYSLRQPLASWPVSPHSTSRPWCRCGCSRSRSPAGNTFVLKPSEKDPSASLLLASLWAERDCRTACSTWCTGQGCVDAILGHPDIAAVSFVGSTPGGPLRVRARHHRGQAGPGARRRQEPHGGPARRRPGPGRGRGRVGGVRLGRGAVHGHLGAGGCGARGDELIDRIRARISRLGSLFAMLLQ